MPTIQGLWGHIPSQSRRCRDLAPPPPPRQPQQDVKWWQTDENGAPTGLLCFPCGDAYDVAYIYKSDIDLVSKIDRDDGFKTCFLRARAVRLGEATRPTQPSEVVDHTEVSIEMRRSMLVLTKNAYKRRFGVWPEQLGHKPCELNDEHDHRFNGYLISMAGEEEDEVRQMTLVFRRSSRLGKFIQWGPETLTESQGAENFQAMTTEPKQSMLRKLAKAMSERDLRARAQELQQTADAEAAQSVRGPESSEAFWQEAFGRASGDSTPPMQGFQPRPPPGTPQGTPRFEINGPPSRFAAQSAASAYESPASQWGVRTVGGETSASDRLGRSNHPGTHGAPSCRRHYGRLQARPPDQMGREMGGRPPRRPRSPFAPQPFGACAQRGGALLQGQPSLDGRGLGAALDEGHEGRLRLPFEHQERLGRARVAQVGGLRALRRPLGRDLRHHRPLTCNGI